MQSLSPDTLWIVSTFVSAKTLSAMTRVSKEWRHALVERKRPWAYDTRFHWISSDSSSSLLAFMASMRILAPEYIFSHTAPADPVALDLVCASVKRVLVSCACPNALGHDVFLPLRAETYAMNSGCNCFTAALERRGPVVQNAIRHVYIGSYEAAAAFRHLQGSITHVRVLAVNVRPTDYPTAHTLVFQPSRPNRTWYLGTHPHVVLVLHSEWAFDVLSNAGMFGAHRRSVVIVAQDSAHMFVLLHMVSAMTRGNVSVLFVFDTRHVKTREDFRHQCETLADTADSLGLRLVCRDAEYAHARNAWWTEADELVAMALEPADRRVRARIGE